jgi:hypothetical protein
MKQILFFFIFLTAVWAQALPKADKKEIHSEEFTATVNLQNGGYRCSDPIHSGFGDFPGGLSVQIDLKDQLRYVLHDESGYIAAHEDFVFKFNDPIRCADLLKKLPLDFQWVKAQRKLEYQLENFKDGNSRAMFIETITIPLAKDLSVSSSRQWIDWVQDSTTVPSNRDLGSLILDYPNVNTKFEQFDRNFYLIQGLKCENMFGFSPEIWKLTLRLPGTYQSNPVQLEHVTKNEEDCLNTMTELIQELQAEDGSPKGIKLYVDRTRTQASRIVGQTTDDTTCQLYNKEKIETALGGLKFVGTNVLPIWNGTSSCGN